MSSSIRPVVPLQQPSFWHRLLSALGVFGSALFHAAAAGAGTGLASAAAQGGFQNPKVIGAAVVGGAVAGVGTYLSGLFTRTPGTAGSPFQS